MIIIFPMAGLSSRFTKAGYDKPKYMLDLKGNSVFFHAVN
ncbi:capsular biosynthesis protein, partial [Campylobacter jejuni]|nr:capsular biosynthesis protein [Campylobacter jejuni]